MLQKEDSMEEAEREKQFSRTTLDTIANGALKEKFAEALAHLMANVDDPNTEAKQKRRISIEIDFTPDGSRQSVEVVAKVKSKLASTKAAESVLFVVRN